jgi:hypothetical protein
LVDAERGIYSWSPAMDFALMTIDIIVCLMLAAVAALLFWPQS